MTKNFEITERAPVSCIKSLTKTFNRYHPNLTGHFSFIFLEGEKYRRSYSKHVFGRDLNQQYSSWNPETYWIHDGW